jgi:predicted RNA-binding Zn-ribbon protein involved in translation (DUF1610 family)
MEAKLVLHHDDSPCYKRLDNGYCSSCRFVPDMQSLALYYYCPRCDVPLTKMKCPICGQTCTQPKR